MFSRFVIASTERGDYIPQYGLKPNDCVVATALSAVFSRFVIVLPERGGYIPQYGLKPNDKYPILLSA